MEIIDEEKKPSGDFLPEYGLDVVRRIPRGVEDDYTIRGD